MTTRPAPRLRAPAAGWRWAVLGALLGGALALALFAPARWLGAALADWSEGRLLLLDPRGTVWNGTAGLAFAGGAEPVALPGAVLWRLRPGWRGVMATLDVPCCAAQPLQLHVQPQGGGGVQIDWRDGRSQWPATLLRGLGAPWNTLKLEGTLSLTTQDLSMRWDGRALALAGQATLDATDISSSLSTLRPMGSYRLALAGGAAPSVLLSTLSGSLELTGSGLWNGRALRFNGEAAAAAGREDALANLLNIIGRRDNARSIITLG